MFLLILKVIFLFFAILFSIANVGNVYVKAGANKSCIVAQSLGITGFITLQWLI